MMQVIKHTPGPWPLFDNAGLTLKRRITVRIGIVSLEIPSLADAQLISTAPEMAAILRELAYGQTSGSRMNAILAESRAILAQIEGE